MRPSSATDFCSPSTVTRSRAASRWRRSASRKGCSVLVKRSVERVGVGRLAGLRLLRLGHAELPEEHLLQLLRRAEVDLRRRRSRPRRPPGPAPPWRRSPSRGRPARATSTAMPVRSMRASTSMSGSSTSASSSAPPVAATCSSSTAARSRTAVARTISCCAAASLGVAAEVEHALARRRAPTPTARGAAGAARGRRGGRCAGRA